MDAFLKKVGRVLTILGLANLIWLAWSWVSELPIASFQILGLFVLVFGLALISRPGKAKEEGEAVSPSRREEQKHQHKSWIESGKK
jgi:hypothetical protein